MNDDIITMLQPLSPSLRILNLSNTKITDTCMCVIGGFPKLIELSLDRTRLTDVGLKAIFTIPYLKILSISQTRVTNTVLLQLQDATWIKSMESLNLSRCENTSDEGIPGLTVLINLQHLNLDHTKVTRQCIKILKGIERFLFISLLLAILSIYIYMF